MGPNQDDPNLGRIAAMFENLWDSAGLVGVGTGKTDWERILPIVRLIAARPADIAGQSSEAVAASDAMTSAAASLLKAVDRKDVDGVAIAALRLGVCFYRTFHSLFAEKIRVARRVYAGGQKGHESTYGPVEKRRQEYRQWQGMIEEILSRNRRVSFTQACRKVGKQVRRSYKTIGRHTTDPRVRDQR
jgi:hypothetical protein